MYEIIFSNALSVTKTESRHMYRISRQDHGTYVEYFSNCRPHNLILKGFSPPFDPSRIFCIDLCCTRFAKNVFRLINQHRCCHILRERRLIIIGNKNKFKAPRVPTVVNLFFSEKHFVITTTNWMKTNVIISIWF